MTRQEKDPNESKFPNPNQILQVKPSSASFSPKQTR